MSFRRPRPPRTPPAAAARNPQNPQGTPDNGPGKVLSFPEPKGKRRRRILLSTIGIVAVLMAGIVAAAVYSPVLALRTVTVEGTKMLHPDQVQAALAPLQGKPLPQISEEEVTALLKPLVQVKGVTAKALPPATLQVHVTERIPVALVKQGKTFQLVDVDGVQLSTTADAASVSLPVIDGGSGTLPKDLFQAITAVLGPCRRMCWRGSPTPLPRLPTPSNSNSSTGRQSSGATRGRRS